MKIYNFNNKLIDFTEEGLPVINITYKSRYT